MRTVTKDPVCGREVDPAGRLHADHAGVRYLFCSEDCRSAFVADPGEYVSPKDSGSERDQTPEAVDTVKKRQRGRGKSWKDYIPLLVLVILVLAVASAKQMAYPGAWKWHGWMHDFMGFFLVVFSMFKFFDLPGFADGFQMYDLLAKPLRPYAYLYPFLECGLGLGYLAEVRPPAIYIATLVLLGFGSVGVLVALFRKLDIECACMGTVLHVPLSTVALVEDLGMVIMAAGMLAAAR